MGRSRVAALCAAVAMIITGCSQTVRGAAAPEDAALTERLFEQAEAAIKHAVTGGDGTAIRNMRATSYWYVRFAGGQLGTESDVSLAGNDPAILEKQQSKTDPSATVVTYHPSSATVDYVRLGPKFAHLVPTPWVSYPTLYRADVLTNCLLPAIGALCNLEQARNDTEKANPPGLRKSAKVLSDGTVELRTGATVKSLIEKKALRFSPELAREIRPEMTGAVVPVKIELNADRSLRKVEANGEVLGKPTPLLIQIGFESRGPTYKTDFPQPPRPEELTTLPTEEARQEFWRKINDARGAN